VLDRVPVDGAALAAAWDALAPAATAPLAAPTLDMLMGVPLVAPPASAGGGAGAVPPSPPAGARVQLVHPHAPPMLVHGYCSSGTIWPAADFTEPKLVFLDPNANRTNDQFAQLLLAFGAQKHSFGVVAHSQGGMAALHLYTFYQSGLDHALGPRLIQSLA